MTPTADAFEYDAFISYSHADQEWVRGWLAPALRAAGLRVCVDYDSFRVGEPIVKAIERAVTTSRKTLMVLTPGYLDSDWGDLDNILVQTLDPNAQQLRLLPIMHIACEPPLRIRALNWADLRRKNPDELAKLIAAIRSEPLPVAPTQPAAAAKPARRPPPPKPGPELILRFSKLPDPAADFDAPVPLTVHFAGSDTEVFDFVNPLADADLADLRWYIERYPAWPVGPDYDRAQGIEARLRVMGKALFDAVFSHASAMRLFERLDGERFDGKEALLTIDTTEPMVLRLPWELLADEGGYLFSKQPPINVRRRMHQERRVRTRRFDLPVRILMVVSRPEDAGFFDPRSSAAPLLDALAPLGDQAEVEFLRPPTLAALTRRLRSRALPPVHVLHFDGHGVYRPEVGLGFLFFEDDAHKPHPVDAEQLGTLLNDCGIPLVVLDACQTATPDERNAFGSVAARLIESGVGSVVAMNYSVLVETARRLTGHFYGGLAAGHTVRASLDNARLELMSDSKRITLHRTSVEEEIIHLQDWFVPALYQQEADLQPFAPDGRKTEDERGTTTPAGTTVPVQPARGGFPPEPQHGFHGRGRELLALERLFADKPAVVLHGFGGQGKTSLAAHAARWLTRTGLFERAAFVSFEHGADLDVVLAELGNALVSDDFAIHEGNPVQAVADALAATPTLVVFDNFESVLPAGDAPLPPEALKALLDAAARWFTPNSHSTKLPSTRSRLLVTTRDPAIPHPFLAPGRTCAHTELPGLAPDDALAFAGAVLADRGLPRPSREGLSRLMGFLGNHPLSIQLVLPHLGEAKAKAKVKAKVEDEVEVKDEVEAVIEEFDALLPGFTEGEGAERSQSLEVSLRFSLRRLGPEAAGLLPRLAVFQGGAIENVLLGITEIDEAAWAGLKPALANAALIRLEELGGVSEPYVHFHPTLAPYLARELPDAERAPLEERYWRGYYAFANYQYQMDTKYPAQVRAVTARELPNLRRGLRLTVAAGALDEAAGFADSINRFLDVFGRWRERDEVAAMVERAMNERIGESANLEAANQRINESANQRINESANGETGDAIRKRSADRPQYAPRTTQSRITKAQYLLESGRGERLLQAGRAGEAETVFRALGARLDAGAAYDAGYDRTVTLGRLGRCLRAQGRPAAAAAQYRAALEAAAKLEQSDLERQAAGVIHTDLADALTDLGQYAAARAEYEAGLKLAKQVEDDRQQGVVLGQLGTLALAQGNLAEARRRYLEALAARQRTGELQGQAIYWHQLGVVAQKARDWEEAERCYKESLAISEKMGNLAYAASTSNQLAIVAKGAGRPADAERWFLRAIELDERIGNPKEIAPDYSNLADLLLAQGRLDEAEEYVRKALAIDETLDLSVEPWKDYGILAKIAEQRGQVEAARGWRRKEQETFAAFAGSEQQLQRYEPLIQAIAAACSGNQDALAQVEPVLKQMAAADETNRRFAEAARRLLGGERDAEALTHDLDMMPAMTIRRILARLAGGPHPPAPSPLRGEGESGEGESEPARGESREEPISAEEEGITLPQLLELVERAARGDRDLGMQLFPAMQQMAGDGNAPPEIRALAGVLARVLIGDRNPDLDALPAELASAVRGMLARLKV